MELMKIMEPDSGIDAQRQRLIAFGRRKEDELGCGRLFATVLISPIENTRWSGLFSDCDKTIKINGSVFRNRSGYFTDTIFLHELAHAFDHASDGVEYIEDFYVYQECGTPVNEHEIDNAKRQWAYVKWSLEQ